MSNSISKNIPLIRQVLSNLTAQSIVGVQPMTGPADQIFSFRFRKEDPDIAKFHQKYKFSRAKWYVVEFDEKNYDAVREWCSEHFGPHPKRADAWCRWWHRYETSIHFANEDDAILFKLTWGENASTE